MNALVAENVTKIFGSGRTAVQAVNGVSLAVKPGEVVLIMGPSGSGKTTLLTMLGTLLHPSSGKIAIAGQAVETSSRAALAKLRLHKIGFVYQNFNLLAALTARQNVAVPLLAAGVPRRTALAKAGTLLTSLKLEKRADRLPQDLSGGEKQRVAIARALANDPAVILADEPTANLDSKTGREVAALMSTVAAEEGRSVVIVSHDTRLIAIAHRVVLIEDGRLVSEKKGRAL